MIEDCSVDENANGDGVYGGIAGDDEGDDARDAERDDGAGGLRVDVAEGVMDPPKAVASPTGVLKSNGFVATQRILAPGSEFGMLAVHPALRHAPVSTAHHARHVHHHDSCTTLTRKQGNASHIGHLHECRSLVGYPGTLLGRHLWCWFLRPWGGFNCDSLAPAVGR